MKNILLLISLLFSTQAICSDEFHWLMENGSKAPNKENQKSISSFGGWLLAGIWTVTFEMKYFIRGVSVPLKTSFNLVE